MKTKTNLRKRFFNWHMWTGIIFTIPILLVAITAIMIAHHKGLGTKEIAVNAGWLPGYSVASEKELSHYTDDVKAVKLYRNTTYYGTKLGVLYAGAANKISILPGTEGMEVRDLQVLDDKLFVASKGGILKLSGSKAVSLIEGDFHGIDGEGNNLIASAGKMGFYNSNDGGTNWSEAQRISQISNRASLATLTNQVKDEAYMEKLSLEKLALDIHTGKAFFGEGSMWIWIDLISISFLLMTLTGIYMWYKRKYGKKKMTKEVQTERIAPQPYVMRNRNFAAFTRV